MSPGPIQLDRAAVSEAVVALVAREGHCRLSDMFLKIWDGHHEPSEALSLWLKDRGLEIVAGGDYHGSWEVRKLGAEPVGQMPLL